MVRRITAFLGILLLLVVALLLLWRIYTRHRVESDENAVVYRIEGKIFQTLS